MSEELQPKLEGTVYYVPTIAQTTSIAKTILVLNIIGHSAWSLFGVLGTIGCMEGSAKSSSGVVMGLLIIAWSVAWLVLSVKGFNSINRLRQECLNAKGVVYR
jgi:hypothetical protein